MCLLIFIDKREKLEVDLKSEFRYRGRVKE